jgi:hypothetical protein
MFFTCSFVALALLSIGLVTPVVLEFLETGVVRRFPTAILSAAIMLLAFLSVFCGLILDTVTHSRRELKRLAYLEIPAPKWLVPAVAQAAVPEPSGRVAAATRAESDLSDSPVPQRPLALS